MRTEKNANVLMRNWENKETIRIEQAEEKLWMQFSWICVCVCVQFE